MTAELINRGQKKKAEYRLRELGYAVSPRVTLEQLAEFVAQHRHMPLPERSQERTALVRAFANEAFQPKPGMRLIPIVPLKLSKPMLEAMERAHELYLIPSLSERLEAEQLAEGGC